ncbi:MAG: gluconate 2-dehydrogenase subunit 3 family protein [Saprospiraceae bacterium]|nr:gluconate 2-dehydrogenase subunit 3 family protein [Saprospiraceae bacterium]
MKRRKALQNLIFFSIAANALVSCKDKNEVLATLHLDKIKLPDDELAVIDDMVQKIFPVNSVAMFRNHSALPFVLQMLNDCYGPEDHIVLSRGVAELNGMAFKKYSHQYLECSENEKNEMLKSLNARQEAEATPSVRLVSILKSETLMYFTTTELFLRKYRLYEMSPARYLGCIKKEDVKTKNA